MTTICESLLDLLADVCVREIFGITGDALNSLVDAIRRDDRFDWVTVRHEETAAFAAAAQAKITGRLAVCAGTVGPGALHLLNGLYDAKRDYAPVLAITGQVPELEYGSSYFQEVDLERVFGDVAVFNQTVRSPEQFVRLARQAIQAAIEDRGVAHLSIPVDLIGRRLPSTRFKRSLNISPKPITRIPDATLNAAVDAINSAERPVILAGDGCRGARIPLLDLAGKLQAPIVHSLKGSDVVEYDHPLWVGGIGHLGTPQGLAALDGCDLLIMAGCDFPYHAFLPTHAVVVQIDNRAKNIGRRCTVTHPLVGDAEPVLESLADRVTEVSERKFLQRIQKRRERWDLLMDKKAALDRDRDTLHPQSVVRLLSDKADDDAVFIVDVGTVTVWSGRHLRFRGRQRLFGSFNHGSLGVGLPGALGVQSIDRDRQVIALCGDGAFGMLMTDLVTAVRYKLPIIVVVFNNGKFGFVELEMQVSGFVRTATDLTNPDFVAVATACGATGIRVTRPDELEAAIDRAFADGGPVLIDAQVNPDELFAPAKIEVSAAWGYTLGKVKELLVAPDEIVLEE